VQDEASKAMEANRKRVRSYVNKTVKKLLLPWEQVEASK